MRAALPSKVTLETRLGSVAAVSGDGNQIRQALLNLTMNAGEACGDEAGTVVVSTGTERIELFSEFSARLPTTERPTCDDRGQKASA